jgi:hypothetical protein
LSLPNRYERQIQGKIVILISYDYDRWLWFIIENMLATVVCHCQYYWHIHAMGFPVIRSANKFSVRNNQWYALSRLTEIALVMCIRHNYVRVTNCIRCILSRWVAFNFNNRRNIQCWVLI